MNHEIFWQRLKGWQSSHYQVASNLRIHAQ